jgi:5'-nucleotidase
MNILVTNDDGIYAPGLAALASQMRHLGNVFIAAPSTEQSGVGHSITYLTPLVCKEIFRDDHHWGWAVDGSPADCVKLAISQICPVKPDLVVSGINSGLNAGINVLYSGTVAAAIEGAFFGIRSFAVSLQYDPQADFAAAAVVARNVIGGLLRYPAQQAAFSISIFPLPQRFNLPPSKSYRWAWNSMAAPTRNGSIQVDAVITGQPGRRQTNSNPMAPTSPNCDPGTLL